MLPKKWIHKPVQVMTPKHKLKLKTQNKFTTELGIADRIEATTEYPTTSTPNSLPFWSKSASSLAVGVICETTVAHFDGDSANRRSSTRPPPWS